MYSKATMQFKKIYETLNGIYEEAKNKKVKYTELIIGYCDVAKFDSFEVSERKKLLIDVECDKNDMRNKLMKIIEELTYYYSEIVKSDESLPTWMFRYYQEELMKFYDKDLDKLNRYFYEIYIKKRDYECTIYFLSENYVNKNINNYNDTTKKLANLSWSVNAMDMMAKYMYVMELMIKICKYIMENPKIN